MKKFLVFHHYYTMINSSQTLKKKLKYFIAEQCSLINASNDLPSVLSKKMHKLLSTIHFTSDDNFKIIKNLDPNKRHGNNMISIRIIKFCDASFCKPLELILKSCLEHGKFPTDGKKLMWF